jgi:hypothetical protein
MIGRRLRGVALTAVFFLGAGTGLAACESEEQQQIDRIKDDVGKELDKLEDQIDKNVGDEGGGNN